MMEKKIQAVLNPEFPKPIVDALAELRVVLATHHMGFLALVVGINEPEAGSFIITAEHVNMWERIAVLLELIQDAEDTVKILMPLAVSEDRRSA